MIARILEKRIAYDGSQIAPLWAYRMGIPGDSIVAFRGPMDVSPNNMKDLEDEMAKKTIKGDDVLHIIVERFSSPATMRLAYYMQRLLIVCIRDVLEKHGIKTIRKGDDLFIDDKKLTVSIASTGVSCEKIHCGINISTEGTPDDIRTTSLGMFGLTDWKTLAIEISETFVDELEDIESDIAKTRSL